MFNGKRYATNGVIANIPIHLQSILWYLVEIMPEPKDHLQVFELKAHVEDGNPQQKIIHRQENPEYQQEHLFSVNKAIYGKVYIIDDGDHSTMLIPEEY